MASLSKIFTGTSRSQRKRDAAEAARLQQEELLKEQEARARFATTEGQGIAEQTNIDLSFEDEDDELLSGRVNRGFELFL